ncbi:MAG: hypothetical protein VX642_05860 [Bdellovibrionota bacterium]|nr:hypothetical protein [Bdellovibrionota bacterium]
MIKLSILAVLTVLMGWQSALAEENAPKKYQVETALQMRLMKSGEWPLPRIAPFPIRDIVGQWGIQPNDNVVIDVKYVGTDSFNRHKVDVRMFDRETGMLVGRGPALVSNNILRSYNLNYGNQPFYFEMVSLVPPKNSAEAKNNEKMVYAYLQNHNDQKQVATVRIKKIQPPTKKDQKK